MTRWGVSVEGPTERDFVTGVVAPHLLSLQIFCQPVVIQSSRKLTGEKLTGGSVTIERAKRDVMRLLASFDFVTTFYDYYGFQGRGALSPSDIEDSLKAAVGHAERRFLPYIQVHEFEALLFSDPQKLAERLGLANAGSIQAIVQGFGSPEDINNNPATAPSKRIQGLSQRYDKVLQGPQIAANIGLAQIRQKCARFDNWLAKIENAAV